MADVLARGGDQLTEHQRAVARFYVLWREMWDKPAPAIAQELADLAEPFARAGDDLGVAMATSAAGLAQVQSGDRNFDVPAERLRQGAERFRASGSFWGEVLSLVALGRIEHLRQHPDAALALFRQANEAAVTGGDGFGSTIATHHLGRELLASGQVEEARGVFHSGLLVSIGLHHDEGIAYTLEGLCAIAAIHGEVDRAGVLAGAAASIRHRVGMYDVPEFVFHDDYLEQLRTPENTARLDAAIARGREYGAIEAAEYALASEPARLPPGWPRPRRHDSALWRQRATRRARSPPCSGVVPHAMVAVSPAMRRYSVCGLSVNTSRTSRAPSASVPAAAATGIAASPSCTCWRSQVPLPAVSSTGCPLVVKPIVKPWPSRWALASERSGRLACSSGEATRVASTRAGPCVDQAVPCPWSVGTGRVAAALRDGSLASSELLRDRFGGRCVQLGQEHVPDEVEEQLGAGLGRGDRDDEAALGQHQRELAERAVQPVALAAQPQLVAVAEDSSRGWVRSVGICATVARATQPSGSSRRPCQTPSQRYSSPIAARSRVRTWMPDQPRQRPRASRSQVASMPSGSSRRGRR